MRHGTRDSRTKKTALCRTALAAGLAVSLAMTPLAAFAEEGDPAGTETEAAPATTATTAAVKHGLYAAAAQTLHSNEGSVATQDDGACGMFAEAGATIIANAASVTTLGAQAAAVSTSAGGGSISIANSQLSTNGTDAPLLASSGIIEADNVTGTAAASPLALVEESGAISIANSALSSSYAGSSNGNVPNGAVALYRTTTTDATSTQVKPASFQASRSQLKSSLATGSFFHLTNTTANIVLRDNDLAFNGSTVKLLTAKGSDAASTIATANASATYGSAGKNGVTATLTAIDQPLEGAVEVDSISSLDFYLLVGSTWTGASSVTANAAGTSLSTNITVNIDSTSGWIVTEDSTVSALNIAKGGKLVDRSGKAVTIVDADGNKLVDGASKVKVSVTGEFSTTVKTSSANEMQAASVDRTAFDEEFATSTAFGTNGAGAGQSDEERAAELQALIVDWFNNL